MARLDQVFALKLSAKSLPRSFLQACRRLLERILGFPEFNATYAALPAGGAIDFPRLLLAAMKIRVSFAGLHSGSIPATGPLLVVANHSFGFIEGIALDALLLERRPDVAFLAAYVFAAIPELRERYIFVDPARSPRRRKLNPQGLREALNWLGRGGTLGVFPGGDVARFSWRRLRPAEQPWSSSIAGLARRTQTSVLPIYFHGRNGWFFQLAGLLHPRLQQLLFVREITNKRGRTLRATVGRLIEPAELARFASDDDAIRFLREETEKLAQP